MYALREMEDAIDDCVSGDTKRNADSVQALDEAVAFYTGSLEGTDGSTDGVFVHALAEKRCADFKTCGANGDQITGNAKVNINIFSHFSQMKSNIASRNCEAARLQFRGDRRTREILEPIAVHRDMAAFCDDNGLIKKYGLVRVVEACVQYQMRIRLPEAGFNGVPAIAAAFYCTIWRCPLPERASRHPE